MENASDAIIMAGAMLIFVIAISVAMTVFSQARATIDTVVYASDETNYYEYLDTNGNVKNRIVGLETIIPTLYKYYKENYTVVFLDKNGNGIELYKSKTDPLNWSGNDEYTIGKIPPITTKYPGMGAKTNYSAIGNHTIPICSFDVDEETARHEPWTGSTIDYKNNIDAFLEGKEFHYPSNDEEYYDYKYDGKSFIERYATTQFIETIGEYSLKYTDSESSEPISSQLDKGIRNNKNKRVIVYQEK